MTRCKPGDLAFVIRGRNAGTMVSVGAAFCINAEGRTKFRGFPFIGHGPAWVCKAVGRPLISEYAGKEVQFYERPIADSSLRPITPPPGSVDEEETRELYDPRELVLVTRERA